MIESQLESDELILFKFFNELKLIRFLIGLIFNNDSLS